MQLLLSDKVMLEYSVVCCQAVVAGVYHTDLGADDVRRPTAADPSLLRLKHAVRRTLPVGFVDGSWHSWRERIRRVRRNPSLDSLIHLGR